MQESPKRERISDQQESNTLQLGFAQADTVRYRGLLGPCGGDRSRWAQLATNSELSTMLMHRYGRHMAQVAQTKHDTMAEERENARLTQEHRISSHECRGMCRASSHLQCRSSRGGRTRTGRCDRSRCAIGNLREGVRRHNNGSAPKLHIPHYILDKLRIMVYYGDSSTDVG